MKSLFLLVQDVPKLQKVGRVILEEVLSGIHLERGLAKWLFALAEWGFAQELCLFLIIAAAFGTDIIKY